MIFRNFTKISFIDSGNTHIEVLNLNYCQLGHSNADHAIESFKNVKKLREAYVKGLNLVETNKLIGQAFIGCKNLETLDISDNGVQLTNQRCHDAIQDLIINTKKLKHLIMDDFEINNEEGKNYVDSLHMNCTLTSFKFEQHPSLTVDTIRNIEKELFINTTVDGLILPHYSPEHPSLLDLSLKHIAKVDFIIKFLKCNQNVLDVNLSGNKLDDTSAKEIADFIINKQRKLHILDLSNNKISIKGCKEIGRMLYRDSEVLNIDLSHNSIGTEGLLELLKSLKKNMMTRKLQLNECQICKFVILIIIVVTPNDEEVFD